MTLDLAINTLTALVCLFAAFWLLMAIRAVR